MTTEYTYLLFFSLCFSLCLFTVFCLLLSLYIYIFFPGKKVRSIYKNVINIFR